ncbi:MAG: hypothetical protein AMXMBFR59_29700 [Rhodanobacteraceae bacterium]
MTTGPGALAHYLRCYDADLDPALCTQLIASFKGLARFQRGNGRGIRAGLEDSAWTELDISPLSDPAFRGFLMSRVDAGLERYNQEVGLRIAVPPARRISELVIKRYRPDGDERFQLHFDSIDAVANRYLVFLWYLNDVADGGETRFPDLGVSVQPRAGRLLMFPPYWMYQHEAPPPRSGEKYILSTYLLF